MLYPSLANYVQQVKEHNTIHAERQKVLQTAATAIQQQLAKGEKVQLTFICTHNSRRSHFAQIWAAVAAHEMGLSAQIKTFSGGTEATAFHPNALAAAKRAGFEVTSGEGANPVHELSFADDSAPIICFSKTYDDEANPQENFMAVMTCSDADANCPFVPCAMHRFKVMYNDPKVSDGTPQEAATYDERCLEIAAEMWFMMREAKQGN